MEEVLGEGGTESRSRTCAFDATKNEEALTDERSCHPEAPVHCGVLYLHGGFVRSRFHTNFQI